MSEPHTSELNCGFNVSICMYIICCMYFVCLKKLRYCDSRAPCRDVSKNFHSAHAAVMYFSVSVQMKIRLREMPRKESWSVSIYCTRENSCLNKPGYLQNAEAGRYPSS